MRKGFVLILVGVFATCVALYGLFIFLPRPRHQEVISEALAAAEKSYAAAQVDASDATKNGWLSPTFLPFWGRKDKEADPTAKINKIVGDWRDFSTPGAGKFMDHGNLLSTKEPNYTVALADFEKVAPELLKSFNAPRFVAPETHLSYNTMTMNYIAIRASAQAMVGLAEVRVIQGRNGEALDELVSLVVLAKNMRSQGAVISDAIAVAISGIGFDAITGLIDPRAPIAAPAWKKAAATFTAAVPPKDQLLIAMQMDMMATTTSFRDAATQSVAPFDGIKKFPGLLGREQRIFDNLMAELLIDLKEGRPAVIEELATPGDGDFLVGNLGFFTEDIIPTSSRIRQFMDLDRRRITGLALWSGVAAYLAETKTLPKDLDQVRAIASLPEQALLTEMGASYQLKGAHATITVPLGDYESLELKKDSDFGPRDWFKQDDTSMTWTF